MRKNKMGKSIITVLLTLIMVFETLMPSFIAFAAQGYEYKGGAGVKVSDLDTSTKYSESLGDNASTEYAGRIWTDKSVYTGDVTFDTFGGGKSTIKLNQAENGEDFLVAYSALATANSESGQTHAPVDVVFIIDISGSMSNSDSRMENGLSRIANTVSAVNSSIDKLMKMNEYTRVAVVTFSNTAEVLMPLDRYGKRTYFGETYDYLSLNTTTPGQSTTLYAIATGDESGNLYKSRSVTGGTNIQIGLYEGMNVLATETDIYADINGQKVKRTPSVVLLSDGAPTYSSSSASWWAPANNNNDGPGGNPYYGNGFKALMTGAYMKNAIDENYKVKDTNYATTFYTIGMGISQLDNYSGSGRNQRYTGEQDLAYITLNPKENWNNDNDMAEDVRDAWNSYTSQTAGGNGTITVQTSSGENYTVRHPQSPLEDIYTADDKNALATLNDSYYKADNASALTTVFEEIVSNIAISSPEVPTEIKGEDPMTSGYITYTDPIGEYMEVKDVKAIIYAGTTFTQKSVNTVDSKTTYIFEGEVHSAVYGDQKIDNILITVDEASDGKQTLVIKIPASVIPLRVNSVTLNADGTVKTHTNNGALPARVVYSVGLKDEVVKESDDGTVYIDRSKISEDYLKANTNSDGSINFYSNIYSNTNTVNGATAGDATVEFEPSHTNKFYYILEDMPIYKDREFKNQVTKADGIKDDTVYYYKEVYYHGTAVETIAIERTGAQLKKTAITEGSDGYLYRAEGSPRLNRILKFEGTKVRNATGTAADFYAPTFQYAQGSTNAYDGKFVIYQGNNGKLSLIAGGNLEIRKTVNAGMGLTAPDKEFTFTLDINGDDVSNLVFEYVVKSGEEIVKTGTVSKDSNTITLKDGQVATIFSLPPATTYTVTEAAVAGFIAQSEGASGTIKANQTSVAAFTNTYNVTPVSFPTSGSLTGKKELVGREWTADDAFTFFITPYNNAPLPENYNADTGVTVSRPDSANGQIATFDFGTIKFTAPGTFRYTIVEKEPENEAYLPGMSYSRALYRLVVNVVDNGNGTIKVDSYDIQRLYDDNANQLFTYNSNNEIVMNEGQEAQDEIRFVNTYSAQAVTRVPVALKDYTDNSGMKPLVSGMFEFKLEAIGVVENGQVVANTASKVPMPEDKMGGSVTTSNEGHNITFPSVTFTQDIIPDNATSITFRYQMSEVTPANKVNGMTYDNSGYFIDVTVAIDPDSHILKVDAVYPNNERIATFKNTYTPIPVTADIDGKKTLNGRDMKSGESFEFSIAGANAVTNNAVRNQIVVIPSDLATVKNAKDGVATDFAFEDIEFKKAGTYVFAVTETAGNAPAVEYDDSTVFVTVVIDDKNDDGNLEVTSVTYSNNKAFADFTNTYKSEFDGTPVSLSGTKNLTGKSLLAGEFYFYIEERVGGVKTRDGVVTHTVDATPDNNGVYSGTITLLDKLTYDAAGTYEYYISEQIPNPKVGGTTYDESKYRYTVTVTDDLEGKLSVTSTSLQKLNGTVWQNATAVVFHNKYEPKAATAGLPLIKKIISGNRAKALEAGEFKFTLSKVSADPADGMILPETTVVSNAANGDVVFDKITFTKPGTYKVAVKEVIPEDNDKLAGITYSTTEIVATFTVVDDRNGTLTATLTNFSGNSIVNEYKADSAEVAIDIKKNFTGREDNKWLATDKFDFEIVVLDPDTQEAIKNGDISFPLDDSENDIVKKSIDSETPNKTVSGKVTVNKPGTYKFIVREIAGNIPGVRYDSQPREIIIAATDNSETAKIEIKVSVNGQETDDLTLTFSNRYDTSSTEISGHDHLWVEKIFTGREDNKWLDTDAFEFTLEAYDDVTKAAVEKGAADGIEMPDKNLVITNANKAHAHFGNIVFHTTGTFKFKVTEIDTGIKGVTYDADNDRIVIVEVTDNNGGALVAEIADGSEKLSFTNTYSAKEVVLKGETNLKISKILTGRNWFADDEFTFVINPFGDTTVNAVEAKDVVMPESAEIKIKAPSANYSGSVEGYFGDITFKKAGIYHFTITEKPGNIKNIKYTGSSYDVTITVTDNNEGQLVAVPAYFGSSVFENKYTPDAVSVDVVGEKELKGNRPLGAGDFEFTVSAVTENAPLPEYTRVRNAAGGKIDFGKIEFEYTDLQPYGTKVFVYEIKEVQMLEGTDGHILGVTYDDKTVTANVTVSYDFNTGKLSAEISYVKQNQGGAKNTFTFENSYKAAASDPISLTSKKKVTPSEGNSFALKGGEFSFVIEGTQGAPMPENTTAKNDANGNINFGTVSFTEKGTYKYTIHEVQETLGGFTYDGEVYTVTVEVEDVIAEAKLKTSVTITDSDNKEAEIIFDNKYNPKETSALIFGKKELDSEHKQIEADEFEFVIEAVTENAPMPADTVIKNTATGTFQFDAITYKKVGTYVYKITEKDLGKHGYTYDDAAYTVTVTVTDEGKGQLAAKVDGVGTADTPAVKFVNSYAPDAVDVILGVDGELSKELEGRDIRAEEFEFAVLDSEEKEIADAKNDKDGNFEFTLNFTKADTYKYTIVEKNNGVAGVTYDESVYSVEIKVIDENGKLKAESVIYALEDDEVDEVVFKNTYKADGTDIIISAVKVLKGRTLKDGEFKFVLRDGEGEIIAVATNKADGKIVFDKIDFAEVGTYKFTLGEDNGGLEHIVYDNTEYAIEVEVTDDGNGKLKAESTVTKKADGKKVTDITFENTYSEPIVPVKPEIPQTGDNTNVKLWLALFFISGGCVFATAVYTKKKNSKKN